MRDDTLHSIWMDAGAATDEKSVEVVTLDIIKDKSSMTQVNAATYKSDKAKRGPLDKQEWR